MPSTALRCTSSSARKAAGRPSQPLNDLSNGLSAPPFTPNPQNDRLPSCRKTPPLRYRQDGGAISPVHRHCPSRKESVLALMTAQVIDGRKLADTLRATVAREVSALPQDDIASRVAPVSVRDDAHTQLDQRPIVT